MTNTQIDRLLALSERLRTTYLVRDEFSTCHPLCNPDGPEAADAIGSLLAKIAELEGERDALLAERDAASARVGEMREALEPFAAVGELIELETEGFDDADTYDLMHNGYLLDRLAVADFRRARLARGEG